MPDGTFRFGGTVTYSALAAARLGVRVGVLTSAEDDAQPFGEYPTVAMVRRPAVVTTTFENVYEGRHRRQYVRAQAPVLTRRDLPPGWAGVPVVHLAPVAQEVDDSLVEAFPRSLLGVTPQGWLRSWNGDGLVSPLAWAGAGHVLARAQVVVLSLEDLGGDQAVLEDLIQQAQVLVCTVGEDGAIVHHGGHAERVPAFQADEVDPTGAGDVFATAFFIRLRETDDLIEAARFANCVASFVVEGVGTSAVPTREQVEWRLQHGQRRG